MTTDKLGRRRAETRTETYGACRCCERWFVDVVTDRATEARHEKDGYCGGCARAQTRHGTCSHEFPASLYRCSFTADENALHTIRFLNRIRRPGHHRKDPLMGIRTDLLSEFIHENTGHIIGDPAYYGISAVDLGTAYLRYLTGNTDLEIPGDAIHWAPLTEDPATAVSTLYRLADWTAARRGKHAPIEEPQRGDLVVFAGRPGDMFGTLGIYLHRDPRGFHVFTQGHHDRVMPATEYTIPASVNAPLGWWRVRSHIIEARTQEVQAA